MFITHHPILFTWKMVKLGVLTLVVLEFGRRELMSWLKSHLGSAAVGFIVRKKIAGKDILVMGVADERGKILKRKTVFAVKLDPALDQELRANDDALLVAPEEFGAAPLPA